MHVLLIEDDALVAKGIAAGLGLSGFAVDVAASLSEARALFDLIATDVVVVDRGLPDGDGLSLVREWRKSGRQEPILVLTARDGVSDRVAGLRDGADDYLIKPFDLDELLARLQALLRRTERRAHPSLSHGTLRLDEDSREVTLNERAIALSRRELCLLETLMRQPRKVFSAERLKDSLYGLGEEIESNALNVHIYQLRRKLGPGIIETIRGQGYRLGPPPTCREDTP